MTTTTNVNATVGSPTSDTSGSNMTNAIHYRNRHTNTSNTIQVANDLLSAIEYCGIDRDGYTDRDPQTTSLCDVQLIGQVVAECGSCGKNDDAVDVKDLNTSTGRNTTPTRTHHLSTLPLSYDTSTSINTTTQTGVVLACRFLLASRSVVLYRMLYGNYREAKTQSIALLRYPILILESIVYFCSYHTLNPLFPTSVEHLEYQFLLLQAADYLQLIDLCTLVTQTILMKHVSMYPERTVCLLYEQGIVPSHCYYYSDSNNHNVGPSPNTTTSMSSSYSNSCSSGGGTDSTSSSMKLESSSTALSCLEFLFTIAQQMIETRPYITLDPNNTYSHHIQNNNNNININDVYPIGPITDDKDHKDDSQDIPDSSSGGITQLSLDKLQQLFAPSSKQNICASELFLLHQLLRWYQYQMVQWQRQLQCAPSKNVNNDPTNTDANEIEQEIERITAATKHICDTSIELSHIEPSYLLQFISPSLNNSNDNRSINTWIRKIVTPERIYQAISQQALRASQWKSWSLPYSNGIRNVVVQSSPQPQNGSTSSSITATTTIITIPERVLIEGSGHHDADGMYYRINTNSTSGTSSSGQSIRSSTGSSNSRNSHHPPFRSMAGNHNNSPVKNVLYTKREIMVGQQNVYTLSRCLRYRRKDVTQQLQQPMNEANVGDCDIPHGQELSEAIRTKCLIGSVGVDADGININDDNVTVEEEEEEEEAYYECRIFSSPFLTYRAVRQLQLMQIMSTIVPCYQPVMQLVDWSPPANAQNGGGSSSPPAIHYSNNQGTSFSFLTTTEPQNRVNAFGTNDAASSSISSTNNNTNLVIPTPIRKYYRIRLSDGEYHMPGTIAPELNGLIERKELDVNRVIQILEFGVYTTYGCTSIHVLRAVVVTGSNTTPIHIFGNPSPLEDAEPVDMKNIPDDIQISGKGLGTSYGRLQNLYRAEIVLNDDVDDPQQGTVTTRSKSSNTSNKNDASMATSSFYASGCIPKTGWMVDDHGIEPAPECTWIPPSTTASTPVSVSLRTVIK